jgi:single-stranded-DNA-specific exonuclease
VYSQKHLLHRFGGHPFAAGLSLKQENLELFRDGINQELRRYLPDPEQLQPVIAVDLEVEVQELGQTLFRDLSMLEPCGMGNPVPRLLIRNCWFQNLQNRNIQDRKGQKLKYLKTSFLLCDRTDTQGFGGVWWGHSRDELNENQRYDVIVELDYNPYRKEYEVRLIDVRSTTIATPLQSTTPQFINWRDRATPIDPNLACIPLEHCPQSWDEMQVYFRRACTQKLPLALAYESPNLGQTAQKTWCQLVGIAKYLLRTQKETTLSQLETKLDLDRALLFQGLYLLKQVGFTVVQEREKVKVTALAWQTDTSIQGAIERFEDAITERNFRRQYFAAVDVEILQQQLQYQGR